MSDKRNIYLDYLRGASAVIVVLYHYTARYEESFGHIETYPFALTYGFEIVKLFFLLSGYFGIKYIETNKPFEYAVKRFTKLYPVFWVCMLITWTCTSLFFPPRKVSVREMLINFTMIPETLNTTAVDGVYWSLFCELVFYFLVFMICFLRLQKHTDKILILAAAAQIVIPFLPYKDIFGIIKGLDNKCYLQCFIAGGMIALSEKLFTTHKDTDYSKKEIAKITLYSLTIVSSVIAQFIRYGNISGICFAISTVAVIISVLLNEKNIIINSKIQKCLSPLSFIAAISYPLYLFHQNIGYTIISKLESIGLTNELFIIIPISISVISAYLLNRFVEKPAAALSKKFLSSIQKKSKQ